MQDNHGQSVFAFATETGYTPNVGIIQSLEIGFIRSIPEHIQQIITSLLILAKMEISSKWKTPISPSLGNWYDRIWDCFVMSKVTDKILLKTTNL